MENKIETDDDRPFFRFKWIQDLPISATLESKHTEMAMDYLPRDEDIVICSYVKTGSHFLQYIVWSIFHPHDLLPTFREMKHFAPGFHLTGTEEFQYVEPPRICKHHLPYKHMRINKKAKYIYIYRSPCDVISSFYHFFSTSYQEKPDSIDYFFNRFLEGHVYYGNYFDHVREFYKHRNEPHLLFISYEKLLEDKKKYVLIIAHFLGIEYYNKLLENSDLMSKILKQTEIGYMKKNIYMKFDIPLPGAPHLKDASHYFRKGIIGDGKQFLTSEQIELLKDMIKKKMNGTDILDEWLTLLS